MQLNSNSKAEGAHSAQTEILSCVDAVYTVYGNTIVVIKQQSVKEMMESIAKKCYSLRVQCSVSQPWMKSLAPLHMKFIAVPTVPVDINSLIIRTPSPHSNITPLFARRTEIDIQQHSIALARAYFTSVKVN